MTIRKISYMNSEGISSWEVGGPFDRRGRIRVTKIVEEDTAYRIYNNMGGSMRVLKSHNPWIEES